MKNQPKAILTDQDSWITEAISKELPTTKHVFCIWHIIAKFSSWFMLEEQIYPKMELSALGLGVTLTDLFNPTSGRDASHPYLISIEPKEGCTNHVCVLDVGLTKTLRVRPVSRATNSEEDNT